MIAVLQRVREASVSVEGKVVGEIQEGLLVLLGIGTEDTKDDIEWLCRKIPNLRIFSDSNGLMNVSLKDIEGELLVVSQFTLQASTKKGNRPSYINAAKPEISKPLYQLFLSEMQQNLSTIIQCGVFGADMKVSLVNDGPVTIVLDSKNIK